MHDQAFKDHQPNSLDALAKFCEEKRLSLGQAKRPVHGAFHAVTGRDFLQVPQIPGVPYVCPRVPTGRGETIRIGSLPYGGSRHCEARRVLLGRSYPKSRARSKQGVRRREEKGAGVRFAPAPAEGAGRCRRREGKTADALVFLCSTWHHGKLIVAGIVSKKKNSCVPFSFRGAREAENDEDFSQLPSAFLPEEVAGAAVNGVEAE